jgi:hypothetical protein
VHSLQTRIDALAGHAQRLRKLGTPLFLLGCGLVILSIVVVWPEPSEPGTLNATNIIIPDGLAGKIARRTLLGRQTTELVEPMSDTLRIQFGVLPLVLWLFWKGTALFLRSWIWRGVVLFFGWPFAFWIIAALMANTEVVYTIEPGILADASPLAATRQIDPDAPSVSAALDELRQRRIHLDAGRLEPIHADQARFVIAQQAYLDEQPGKVAAQLRALTGTWIPSDNLSRTIVAVLAGYSEAHGHEAGTIAPKIADGRPHYALRLAVTAWSMRIGTLLAVIGLLLDLTGLRRARAAKRLRAAVEVPA